MCKLTIDTGRTQNNLQNDLHTECMCSRNKRMQDLVCGHAQRWLHKFSVKSERMTDSIGRSKIALTSDATPIEDRQEHDRRNAESMEVR